MSVESSLKKIEHICLENYIGTPYLVGGVPRDIYMGRENALKDIDITTNTDEITRLAVTFGVETNSHFKVFPDKHISVYHRDGTFDFSSNFGSSNVQKYLEETMAGYKIDLLEIYSRDFSINTLHKEFFNDDIIDPTKIGRGDIDGGLVRTCVPANITLSDDPRRIFRAINFAARFGFSIDGDIIDYVRRNRHLIASAGREILKESFLTSIVSSSISENSDIVMGYLRDMNIMSIVPMVGLFKDELITRRLVTEYLDNSAELRPATIE